MEQLNFKLVEKRGKNSASPSDALVSGPLPGSDSLPGSVALIEAPALTQHDSLHQSESNILREILESLLVDFYPNRVDLLEYKISWSTRRQKRTLASCNLRAKRILVAQELNHSDYHKFLAPLIYHELCHAVLGFSIRSDTGRSRWHGKEFRMLEQQHPGITALNSWIKDGGWSQAIRRHRGRLSAKNRKLRKPPVPQSLLSSLLDRLWRISISTKRTKRILVVK